MVDDPFQQAGYGSRAFGMGERAAVLVVDFQRSFTDAAFPMGRSDHVGRAVERTAELLGIARALGVPVANCNVGWADERGMAYWKASACYEGMAPGEPGMELDPRIADDSDFRFTKSAPSMFFGTPLLTFLIKLRIDTLFVTGCTTSGCVRATINDAFSYGYHVMVSEPCCGDQDEAAHRANLEDVGRRYADVLDFPSAAAALRRLGEKMQCPN